MAVELGSHQSGRSGRRRADSFPVLRWLQVGAATAGVGMALVLAPGSALADTDSSGSGADSSTGSSSSTAGSGTAADSGTAEAGASPAESAGTADNETTSDATGASTQDLGNSSNATSASDGQTAEEGAESLSELEAELADAEADSSDAASLSEAGSDTSSGAANTDGVDDADDAEDVEDVEIEADIAAPVAAGSAGGNQDARTVAASSTNDTSGSSGAVSESAPTVSETSSGPDRVDSQELSLEESTEPAPEAVRAAASTVSVAEALAVSAASHPAYPAPVTAPVTWRSILTETLAWLGMGMGPSLPIPEHPVPDLLAGLWIGMRKLQYTFFNSAPVLQPNAATEDPETGIITGDLRGYDANGDVITYLLTEAPKHGTVLLGEDGTYTYTPDAGFVGGIDTFKVTAKDTGPANPFHIDPISGLRSGLSAIVTLLGFEALPDPAKATVTVHPTAAPVTTPTIVLHNHTEDKIWVYNLPNSGDYSIPSNFTPVSVPKGGSTPITLALGTGPVGSPKNRIYIVEGGTGFDLPVVATSGVDAFNPTAATAGNSFLNYNFLEYYLYPADGGYEYTIDISYIDEWSLPILSQFFLNGADWSGAVDKKIYGFTDYDTVVSQLNAAGNSPYGDLVWSGSTPFGPQPPATVERIIGPNKVWTAQSLEPSGNENMDNSGWVPTSYQDFVKYDESGGIYPYAYDGTKYSASTSFDNNFDFWKHSVDGPSSTPYPMALHTAAVKDGFKTSDANGVYGFFTFPNDETAGQFTNIPTSVAMNIFVHGTSDGVSDSVIEGGSWFYTSSPAQNDDGGLFKNRDTITGTSATDTFILDSVFKNNLVAPLVVPGGEDGDIVVIDRAKLGATTFEVDVVDCFWFLGGGLANYDSQFVYDSSSGYLYFDEDPSRFGYTGVLAKLPRGGIDVENTVFVI